MGLVLLFTDLFGELGLLDQAMSLVLPEGVVQQTVCWHAFDARSVEAYFFVRTRGHAFGLGVGHRFSLRFGQ